jgi:hypothetical protein
MSPTSRTGHFARQHNQDCKTTDAGSRIDFGGVSAMITAGEYLLQAVVLLR